MRLLQSPNVTLGHVVDGSRLARDVEVMQIDASDPGLIDWRAPLSRDAGTHAGAANGQARRGL